MTVPTLEGRKIAVFDLEIKKTIEQCSRGWQSHDEMGISCLCIYDYSTGRYRVFDDSNHVECLKILNDYDIVVGFNTVNFDWKVVQQTWTDVPEILSTRRSQDFDILREIWKSLGLDPDKFNPRTHGGYKLDNVAQETIGLSKTGDGALAPKLYQAGRLADVIDYCLEDVRIEKTLFEYIVKHEHVIRHGNVINVNFDYL